ncbi:MAG: hypothetical protein HY246_06910 [Proteobacteria bacterium]|nr:hypothetical protein [Pseudomonadota bacterium]
MYPKAKGWRPTVVALTTLALALQGCAEGGFAPGFSGYTVAADDVCRAERTELKSVEDFFTRSMIQGAVAGAVAGGLAGAIIGGGRGSAVLAGAATGAVVGGFAGYYQARQQAAKSNAELVQSISSDITNENQQVDRTTAAFRRLRTCRFEQARGIKADFAAGKIDRDEAAKRMAKVKVLFQEDVAYAEGLGAKMGERGDQYRQATTEVLKIDPSQAAVPPPAGPTAAPASNAAVATVAARVREQPSADGKTLTSLAPGARVGLAAPLNAKSEWTQVRMDDGRTGYVATRLLGEPGTAPAAATARATPPAPRATTPSEPTTVAALTDSNQFKRKAFSDDVGESKKVAAGPAFDLDAPVTQAPWRSAPTRLG